MKIALLAYEGVEPIDIGATAGVLSMAKRLEPNIETFIVSQEAGEVAMADGLCVVANYSYKTCPHFDLLIVLGGPGWETQCETRSTLNFIQKSTDKAVVSSVCTGAMILAAAGIVENRHVTTRRLSGPNEIAPLVKIKSIEPNTIPVEALVIDNDDIITGGGVTLAIDFMFHILSKYVSEEISHKTAILMEYDRALSANKQYFKELHA